MPLNISGSIVSPLEVREYEYNSIIQNGLVLHLDARIFNTVSGTTWFDLSGNGNHGTLTNGPTFNSDNQGSIVFDGVNDYAITSTTVEAATNSNLQTFSGWLIGNGSLFGSNANSTGRFHLRANLNGTTLSFAESYYGGIAGESNNTVTVSPFSVNNIVIVKTAAEKYDVYFNGNKVMNQLTKKATVSVSFYPGYFYGGVAWNGGTVGSYLIYNRALTQEEIQHNYNLTKYRYGL
jgi:hypothetical protein